MKLTLTGSGGLRCIKIPNFLVTSEKQYIYNDYGNLVKIKHFT